MPDAPPVMMTPVDGLYAIELMARTLVVADRCGIGHVSDTQRLADALVLMVLRATGNRTNGGGSKSNRPALVVICDEETLRGNVEDAGLGYTLDGTPVPPTELRRLACNADILPAVMNGAGHILDFGRSRRLATDTQRLALLTMYGGCIIDGCGAPAELIEIHHLTGHEHGGRTNLDDLAPLCNRDHTRTICRTSVEPLKTATRSCDFQRLNSNSTCQRAR